VIYVNGWVSLDDLARAMGLSSPPGKK